jgi:ferritin-like metal-binding protein YciE
MAFASLREHLVEELHDLLSAERQLVEALPQMQQNASRRELKAAFKSHLAETRGHARRIEQALKTLSEGPSEKTCDAMKGLLEEGRELMEGSDGGALRDAMMITAAQKVEHYEIATYGTVKGHCVRGFCRDQISTARLPAASVVFTLAGQERV